jgi:hypothetical protein
MKDLDPFVFLDVFQEMLGIWLWVMLAIAVLGIAGFVLLLKREGGIISKRFVVAELWAILGGGLALVIMAKVSSSGFTDAGGPADWFLICLVYGAGFVATTILAYAIMGFLKPQQKARGVLA